MMSQAWVEYQYARVAQHGADHVPAHMGYHGLGATVTMSGIQEDQSGEPHNNPFEMVPTTGKLFKQMSSTFLSVTANQGNKATR